MIKRLARSCVAVGCRTASFLRRAEERICGQLVVLCYHRVLPAEWKAAYFLPDLVVTPDCLRRHCAILQRHFEVMPLHQAVVALRDNRAHDRSLAAVTFDDGYRDNCRYAVPILDGFGISATFFVITDLVGTRVAPWYDRLGRAATRLLRDGQAKDLFLSLQSVRPGIDWRPAADPAASIRRLIGEVKKCAPEVRHRWIDRFCAEAGEDDPRDEDLSMNWTELAELAKAGHEIASHGANHEILPQLDDAALEAETEGSRRTIEEKLGVKPFSFCYPNGDTDDRVATAVESAGFQCAVTTEPGINSLLHDSYRLKRCFIHEDRLTGVTEGSSAALLRMQLCNLSRRFWRHGRDAAAL